MPDLLARRVRSHTVHSKLPETCDFQLGRTRPFPSRKVQLVHQCCKCCGKVTLGLPVQSIYFSHSSRSLSAFWWEAPRRSDLCYTLMTAKFILPTTTPVTSLNVSPHSRSLRPAYFISDELCHRWWVSYYPRACASFNELDSNRKCPAFDHHILVRLWKEALQRTCEHSRHGYSISSSISWEEGNIIILRTWSSTTYVGT